MKTYNTYKIGTAALAAVLVLGIGSCAHHRKKSAAPPAPVAPVSQPKPQATVLEAPKSLEGAWIKVKSHWYSEPVGSQTDWWYIKNGKPHYYGVKGPSEGHPATPVSLGTPQDIPGSMFPECKDGMGRTYALGVMSYQPRGKRATLKIVIFRRQYPTLCRSVLNKDGTLEQSEDPAEITFTSAHSGVYHGTIKGVIAADSGYPADSVNSVAMWLDSITIYTE